MQLRKLLVFAGILVGLASHPAMGWASPERGTRPEAEALVKKAVAEIKKEGREKAFARFSDPQDKEFHVKDMYVFVNDMQSGKSLAHINKRLIGKDMINMKDADGKEYVKERIAMVKEKGHGWQQYKYYDPQTHKVSEKETYVERYQDIMVACGIYKQ